MDSPPSEISTLSLHDALPISPVHVAAASGPPDHETVRATSAASTIDRRTMADLPASAPDPHPFYGPATARDWPDEGQVRSRDRKSTRLNSSHRCTSYAVFCLK